ncbi:Autotransporter adhesin [Paraburkholderia fungorum]|uniref:Autotransporter adhesin n=2 Tax=Paraburkholderia fungorum TaxID=134537 RepID=A0A1H1HEC8_9BURK|nr:Autotransporter adhesin [Paraburkholderia fungorum]
MLSKSYKNVLIKAPRIAEAVPTFAKRSGLKAALACRTLMAASAGLLSALTLAQPARAETCAPQAQDCPSVEQVLTAFAQSASADATSPTAATNSMSGIASTQEVAAQPQIAAVAATAPSVTDYISVSENVVQGTRTSASSALNAMAIGPTAAATGINAVAVGAGSAAGSDASTAIGSGAGALSIHSTAIGAGTTVGVLSDNSVAIGYNARSSALNSMSIGGFASATSAGSVAIGYNVFVAQAATNSLSLGSNSSVSAANSVALGSGSVADRANVVAVGNATQSRQIVSVADGTQATDAANVGQLSRVANALGGGASIDTNGAMVAPAYTIGAATYSDVGSALAAAVTAGVQASTDSVQYDSTAHDVVTLGNAGTPVRIANVGAANLAADSSDAVNGGQLFATNQVVEENTSNITNLDQRVTDNTSSITNLDQRVTDNTSSINNLDQRVTDNTSTINNLDTRTTTIEGDVTNITNQITKGEIGLVQQDEASRDLSVAKDTDGARVDFSGTSGARELTGVAAGTTDESAVNLSQLKPVAAALGGGAQINADGSFTAPTYHVQRGTQSTVGDALGSLDSGLSTLQQNMANGGIGVVTQDPVTRAINVGATMDGSLVNMAGTAGKRVVSGVAQGAVSAASSDAVNGSQLYAQAASTAVALGGGSTVAADGTVTAPSYSVDGTMVNNVGSAITNLDTRTSQNSNDIASLQTTVGSINGSVANAVQYDSAAHDRITLGGTSADASKVTLTNLQAGEVSATSSDAVTGAQLWQTNQQITNISQSVQNFQGTGDAYMSVNSAGNAAQAIGNSSVAIGGGAQASAPNSVAIGEGSVADQTGTVSVGSSGNERRITNVGAGQAPTDAVNMQQFQGGMDKIARNAYSGTASAIALTMVPEVDASKNLAIGVATAGYKGYQAVAVGFSARVTPSLKVKIGAGISAATTTVGAGAAYQW